MRGKQVRVAAGWVSSSPLPLYPPLTGRTKSGPEVRGCAGTGSSHGGPGRLVPYSPPPLSLAEWRVAQWGEVMRGKQVRVAAGRVSSSPLPLPPPPLTGRTESGPEVRGCAGTGSSHGVLGQLVPFCPPPLSLAEQRVALWDQVMRGKQVRVPPPCNF